MEAISKPTLSRLSIELPAHVCHLLKCGELTIYDLLELLTNTVSKVVVGTDENATAMEKFALSLAEWSDDVADSIEGWERETEKELLEIIGGKDVPIEFVIENGSIVWDYLSDEVKAKIEAGGEVVEGTPVTAVSLDMYGNLVITLGSGDEQEKVSSTVKMVKEVQAELPPAQTSKPGQSTSVSRSSVGGLMSVEDYEDLQKLKSNMPYLDEDGNLVIGGNKYALTPVEKEYTWSKMYDNIKVLSIEYSGNLSNNGGEISPTKVTYSATEYTLRDGEIYGNAKQVTSYIGTSENPLNANVTFNATFTDNTTAIDSSGVVSTGASKKNYDVKLGEVTADVYIGDVHTTACAYPFEVFQNKAVVTLSQYTYSPTKNGGTIKVKVTKSDGAVISVSSNRDYITASYNEDSSEITIAVQRNGTSAARIGAVSVNTGIKDINGNEVVETINVSQAKGETTIYGYYGKSKGMPTSVTNGSQFAVGDTTIRVKSEDGENVNVHWVAIPTSSTKRVSAYTDGDGSNINPEYVHSSTTAISGYTLYYYLDPNMWIVDTTNFKISD